MRIIAMYLPQYHRVPENDKWWGEGFTDWVAVKAARPLFDGHEQPNVPLNHNYYDLMDKTVMQQQANLMKKYSIDGMCIYHYYFKDGRKILEKPAENLLRWKDIDMPFCFSWANESWVRSWSKMSEGEGNPWSAKFDRKYSGEDDSGILLEQDYGSKQDWINHYEYLRPFFMDPRYIKVGNSPVFMFYKTDKISCIKEMLDVWNELARSDGLDGIFSIGANTRDYKTKGLSCSTLQEPQDTMSRFFTGKFDNGKGVMSAIDYSEICEKMIFKPTEEGQCLGAFPGYDDTPRRENGGSVVYGRSPELFEHLMTQIIVKARKMKSPFVFINAWNEWGEGMYLEPDERYGYKFLEAVSSAVKKASSSNVTFDYKKQILILSDENRAIQKTCDRYHGYWEIMDEWIRLMENDGRISDGFPEDSGKRVMIYGIGMLGKHLVKQLKKEKVNLIGAIDNKAGSNPDVQVFRPTEKLPDPDLIIVTVQYDYSGIKQKLAKKVGDNCIILSLDEILRLALERN
ncbi:MAG: glycoside hydrolase family 99-like domain-containing protein [Eubacterium sp.]|uniref:Glycosyl transferase family WbsX n=1 Tax=Candidatus Weimeria bifida TaxID=2599074 RepID=A0A6N7J102_9FIRM|nr:glycoside hydrolase family 99-like domain-containing protein [Eubacterium sp.]MQN01715.1 hypothetical protein [Candidatus Weimeria bifida]